MEINPILINQFVKAIKQKDDTPTINVYGTIVDEGGTKYVNLDGSPDDVLTPVTEGTHVINGDRVLVSIEDHKAVVLANLTSPASARTATNFMDLTEDGLVIGDLFNPDNKLNCLITPQGYYIRNGESVVAKFEKDGIAFYNNNKKIASFENDGFNAAIYATEGNIGGWEITSEGFGTRTSDGGTFLTKNGVGFESDSERSHLSTGYLDIKNKNGGVRIKPFELSFDNNNGSLTQGVNLFRMKNGNTTIAEIDPNGFLTHGRYFYENNDHWIGQIITDAWSGNLSAGIDSTAYDFSLTRVPCNIRWIIFVQATFSPSTSVTGPVQIALRYWNNSGNNWYTYARSRTVNNVNNSYASILTASFVTTTFAGNNVWHVFPTAHFACSCSVYVWAMCIGG